MKMTRQDWRKVWANVGPLILVLLGFKILKWFF